MLKQPPQLNGRKPLLQFRAGRMRLSDGTVTADPTKGTVSVVSDPTGAVELFWNADERPQDCDTLLLIKGQVSVQRVAKCTTGRVIHLNVNDQRQSFFWLQDKSTERDDEILKKLKSLVEGSTSTHARPTAPPQSGLQIEALQRILADLGEGPATADVSLQDIISSNALRDALREDPAFYMIRLHQHLPAGTPPDGDVVDEVKNPQVFAAAGLLQAALQDPAGFNEITNAFGLPGTGRGVQGFLNRIMKGSQS